MGGTMEQESSDRHSAHGGEEVVRLWPDGAPGTDFWEEPESVSVIHEGIRVVRNVRDPTLTVFLPAPSEATGAGIVICPGGGYHLLSIEMEGTDVARWLASRGIAAFVLKYRLVQTGNDFPDVVWKHLEDDRLMSRLLDTLRPMIRADGCEALRIVRSRAEEWGVDRHRIGLIGFSAGSTVTVEVALNHDAETRPDFAGAIYHAGHADARVPDDAAPLFILCAADDGMATPLCLDLFTTWRDSGHAAELHVYAGGGHGFGMRTTNAPTDGWIERFYDWLRHSGYA